GVELLVDVEQLVAERGKDDAADIGARECRIENIGILGEADPQRCLRGDDSAGPDQQRGRSRKTKHLHRTLPSSYRLSNFINTRAYLPIRPMPKSIHELLQCRRKATSARNDVRSRRQLAGAVAGGRVQTSEEFRPLGLTACDSDRASGMEWAARWRMQRA